MLSPRGGAGPRRSMNMRSPPGVALRQRQLRHGDDLALDLTGRVGEAELRHVPQPGRLGSAGVGDQVPLVERRTTGETARSVRLVLGLAPLALEPIHADMPFALA